MDVHDKKQTVYSTTEPELLHISADPLRCVAGHASQPINWPVLHF